MKKKLPKAISKAMEHPSEVVIQPTPEPSTGAVCENEPASLSIQPAPADFHGAETARRTVELNGSPQSEKERHRALKLVERFAFWAGAAGAIPVPGLDLAGVGAVQVQMVRRLADMFDIEFSQSRGKALIAAIGGAVITGSSGLGAASLTKTIPVLGPAVSSIAVPTLAAGATYAIGIAFIEHFASGGTLLNFDFQQVRAAIRKPR
jgi:uncharacterized protein (DUF697 family)